LRVALTNLVFNAVDAMPAGGTLTLAGRSLGDRIAVAVTDSGVGMTQEVQSRSFEPFFSTKGERGTGLGLAQVFGIMEQHGAAITVDSTPGRGTSFRLIFGAEITGAELVQSAAPEPEIGMERRLRILAVDDEPAMGSMIRRILRSDGHIVVTATSGEEALRHLTAQSFDVVISDVGMGPGMNGWDLAEEVRRRTPRVPVVLATGWGATIEPADAQAKGIDAVLAKPYLPADLKSVLAHLELPGVSVEAA
jgi:CheY-like chemotaxis protein